MISSYDKLNADIEAVKRIPIVPTMLDVICQTTGMRFAAIARVTEDRWIACSVKDEIQFGLEAGGELKIESTICNEIREHGKAVIIDHVAEDTIYFNHHTPKMYGIQSYISFPVTLKNGDFFGTLCAIDPSPAKLNNPRIIGTFAMFAELLSFHLQSFELIERSHLALQETNRQLNYYQEENRQYQRISNHSLQEPLRKIRVFSDFLVSNTQIEDLNKAKLIAVKINSFAQDITKMIQDLTDFSKLDQDNRSFENVALRQILSDVYSRLHSKIDEKKAVIDSDLSHTISASPGQMEQLFFHLIDNALNFSTSGIPPLIRVYSKDIEPHQVNLPLPERSKSKYCEIVIEDNGIGIQQSELEKIFDIFVRSSSDNTFGGFGAGLAHCRKIVHNHGGTINVQSTIGHGASFFIVLPVDGDKALTSSY